MGSLRHAPSRALEADIQRAIVAALRFVLPSGSIVHHSPNEHRARGDAARRVQGIRTGMGLHPGWADIVVIGRGQVLFLEVKTERGRLSPSQQAFRDAVTAQGFPYVVVRSVDDALAAVTGCGLGVRAARVAR